MQTIKRNKKYKNTHTRIEPCLNKQHGPSCVGINIQMTFDYLGKRTHIPMTLVVPHHTQPPIEIVGVLGHDVYSKQMGLLTHKVKYLCLYLIDSIIRR